MIFEGTVHKRSVVKEGQGEFVVYESQGGAKRPLDPSTYGKVFRILTEYQTVNLVQAGRMQEYPERRAKIVQEIQKVNPNLQVFFIPRTTMELEYLSNCLEENRTAECEHGMLRYQRTCQENSAPRKWQDHCWHIELFRSPPEVGDYENLRLVEVARKLNNQMIALLGGFVMKNGAFPVEKILEYTTEQIDRINRSEGESCLHRQFKTDEMFNTMIKGDDISLVQKVVKLECSSLTQSGVFLYRGAKMDKDSTWDGENERFYSHSFGTGLFSGALYDPGACAWAKMCSTAHAEDGKLSNDAFVVHLSFSELAKDQKTRIIHVPATHFLRDLHARGEVFHPRVMLPISSRGRYDDASGFACCSRKELECLYSGLTYAEIDRGLSAIRTDNVYVLRRESTQGSVTSMAKCVHLEFAKDDLSS